MTTAQLKGIKRANYQNIIHIKYLSRNEHVRMILRAMLVVACATGRASNARQVTGDDPVKKRYPGPPGWGLGVRLTTPPRKKRYCYETSEREREREKAKAHQGL
jgi:hypothetical protein